MDAIPFGLSVHQLVSSAGADVGFASLLGLALLVLLFFSQARETATLRARAEEANLRIEGLEGELADLADQVAALPAEISVRAASPRAAVAYSTSHPASPGSQGPESARAAVPPAAPAGVAGPALAAATRLIPDPVRPLPEYEPSTAAGNGNGAARPVVAASAATVERPVQERSTAAPRPVPGPPRPVAAPPRGGPTSGSGARGPGAPQPRYAGPARPSGAPARPPARRSRGRVVFGVLLGVLALAAVAVAVIVLTGGGKSPSTANRSSSSSTLASSRRSTSSSGPVVPSTVTVSVLNGTDVAGLASRVSERLGTAGYRTGRAQNASDQTQANTVVAYMAPADRRDALAVASALKLGQSSVQLIDPNTKAIACPPSQACTSAVVVTVGKDLVVQ